MGGSWVGEWVNLSKLSSRVFKHGLFAWLG